MKLRHLALVAALPVFGSCGDTTPTAATQLNFDRPVDIAFTCYGGLRLTNGAAPTADQVITTSAQPLQSCDLRSAPHPDSTSTPVPPGQEPIGNIAPGGASYFAFILQSEPGTVAIASFDTKPSTSFAGGGDVTVIDADPLTPGKNGITVGEDPVAIATDRVGCFEITANAGSCDMTSLDVNSALNYATDVTDALANHQSPIIDRFTVKNRSGVPVRARPAAMIAEPPAGTIGVACPAQPTGLVYVAYPSCHLVAGIDTSTGTVVTGVQYDALGVASIVTGDVTCPDECGGGGAIGSGPRPVTVDLRRDPRVNRTVLAIGSENTNVVTIAELDLDSTPTSLSNVVLQDPTHDLGVTSVAVTPAIGMGGTAGVINDDSPPGGEMQFVYAVASDNSVRVANIASTLNQECDAQVDPRYIHDLKDVHKLSCFVVGDPSTPPRRPNAHSPGIELVGEAVPTSVAVYKVNPVDTDTRIPGTPGRLIGYFGVITGANGATYVFNIDNDDFNDYVDQNAPIGTSIPLDIAHQLRDGIPQRDLLAEADIDGIQQVICDDDGPDPDATVVTGGPRLAGTLQRTLPAGVLAPEKVSGLPTVRQVKCVGHDFTKPVSELYFAAPTSVRDAEFPDLRGLRSDETWTLTWEGVLSADTATDSVDGPPIRASQMYTDAAGARLVDQTHPYCDAGVEPYDIVQLRGCDPSLGDANCPIGYTCFVHPSSQVAGLGACMLTDEADRLANACKAFLTSLRRYTVGKSTTGELTLLPRKHELRTTPIDGCASDQQCQSLANYALQNASSANPVDNQTAPSTRTYSCAVDPARAPELGFDGNPMKRCIQTCQADADCDAGNVCQGSICMEGVIPPQACVNAPQRYELRASEAFTVIGTRSGYVHPIIADSGGTCIHDPAANPLRVGRLPLRAPACDPTADPRTGRLPGTGFEANPCELTTDQTELEVNYMPGTCTAASPSTSLVTRTADAIRFRNAALNLTIVDPTYPGDAVCLGDRQGTLGKVPLVVPGFQTAFRIAAGFTALLINIGPAYPVKVTRGPGESIWVIDEGDFLSQSITTPSTRGKVYRIESNSLSTINLLQ